MNLAQQITAVEQQISQLQTEIAALNEEYRKVREGINTAPESMHPAAIAQAVRQSTEAESQAQPKLAGIEAGLNSLQPLLRQRLAELRRLRVQQQEIAEHETKKAALDELLECGGVLNSLASQMEEAMRATYQAGLKVNSLTDLGSSRKYELATNTIPALQWNSGVHYLISRQVDLRSEADKAPLAMPTFAGAGLVEERIARDRTAAAANELELKLEGLTTEVNELRAKRKTYGTHPSGQELSWAKSLEYTLSQKEGELSELKNQLEQLQGGVVNAL